MADDLDDEDLDDDEEEGKSVGGKKKLFIILLLLLFLGGAGAGVYFSGILGGDEVVEEEVAEEHKDGEHKASDGPVYDENGNLVGAPVYYELPEFLVNLSTTGKKVSFLKMKVTLELEGEAALPMMDANRPRIQDVFNTYLRELRASDLSGSAGIYRLREELLTRVNKAVHPQQVNDILFSEIIVQ